jgi:hypothetical protein
MTGAGTGPGSRSGGNGTGAPRFALLGCLAALLGVAGGAVSLVVHFAVTSPPSPYVVEFAEPGAACGIDPEAEGPEDADLVLDEETGELLRCSVLPVPGSPGRTEPRGPFAADEVARVTSLAQRLASDADGLTGADQAQVERLAEEIGRENGYDKTEPTALETVTWKTGLYGVIGGLGLLILLGLYARWLETPG